MPNLDCQYCKQKYKKKNTLIKHLFKVHNIKAPDEDVGSFVCEICTSSYSYITDLYRHAKLNHPDAPIPYKVRKLVCKFCGKNFRQHSSLRVHEMNFHVFGGSDFSSPIKKNIKKKIYKCPKCQSKFRERFNMYAHIKRFHLDLEVPYKKSIICSTCKKTFATSSSLKRHRVKFHPKKEDEETFFGNPRDSSPSSSSHVSDNNNNVAMLDPNDSDAEEAGPSFQTRSADSFECTYCRSKFSTYANLKTHAFEKHRKRRQGVLGPDSQSYGVECHFCQERFDSFQELQAHMKDKHPPVAYGPKKHKYGCTKCDFTFPRASTLRVHMKRRHPEVDEDTNQEMDEGEILDDTEEDVDDNQYIGQCLNGDPELLYTLYDTPIWSRHKKLKSEEVDLQFRLTRRAIRVCDLGFSFEILRCVLGKILNIYLAGDPNAWLQIKVDSDTLNYPLITDSSADIEFVLKSLLDQAYHVLGSNDRFMIDSILRISFTYISPNASKFLGDKLVGATEVKFGDCDGLDEYCQLVKTCWTPTTFPPDYGCLGSCLVAALWIRRDKEDGINSSKQSWYRNSATNKEFQTMVDTVYFHADVDRAKPQTWKDFLRFQMLLNQKKEDFGGLQIVAYNSRDPNDYFFMGRPMRSDQKNRINLAVSKTHVYLIRDLASFMKKKVCMDCSKIYGRNQKHTSCESVCSDCKSEKCFQSQKDPFTYDPKPCNLCNRVFHDKECFLNHRKKGICRTYGMCLECHKIVRRKYADFLPPLIDHNCSRGEVRCKHCRTSHPPPCLEKGEKPHYCYIKKPVLKKTKTPSKFYIIAYDYETVTKKVVSRKRRYRGKMKQYPFLAAAVIFCEKCFGNKGKWKKSCPTPGCGKKKRVFFNRPLAFARWLFYDPERRPNVKTVAISHNGKRFDHFFPLSYLLRSGQKPQVLASGKQIMMLKSGRVVLKDFISFCPQKLANLPAAFGFVDTISKGYYPWRYANRKNLNEAPRECLPDRWYYGNDLFKTYKEEEDFENWYQESYNNGFHLKTDSIKYCLGDVEILARAVQHYVTLGLEISQNKVNPILAEGCLTLASFVSLVYRACFMPHEYSIGIVPTCGYNSEKRQSVLAVKYLEWMNQKRYEAGLPLIRHKLSPGGEQAIAGRYVDGWIPSTGEVYEIHGCWYHAHKACSCTGNFKRVISKRCSAQDGGMERFHPLFRVPYRVVSQRSQWKDHILSEHSAVKLLHIIWECQIQKELSIDPIFQSYWNSRNKMNSYWKSLSARDALYGGLVESYSLSYHLSQQEINEGCEIRKMDVVSMYPWIQLTKKFMALGHPEVLDARQLENNGRNWTIEILLRYNPGVATVFILPPEDLYYPTLPCHVKDHTMFLLCWSCGNMHNQNFNCDHTHPTERGIVGTYTISDLKLALENKYQLIQVFEIHTYRKMPETSRLFGGMIKHLIKRKAESSDWPDDALTPEDKQRYIDYWESEYGVKIDPKAVKQNMGMRSLIKLFLVAFWGKFAEKPKSISKEYIRTWARLKSIVFDSRYKVNNLFFEDGQSTYALITYEKQEYDVPETTMHNVVIGAHVTTYARHALLGFMNQVIGRVLSCDTDGFMYVFRPGMPEPGPRGKALGQLLWESERNSFIRSYQSAGAKNNRI